jgi:hypothetical protein
MPDWRQLFPDEDYRFHMGLRKGDPALFYAPTADHEALVTERQHWVRTSPERYVILTENGPDLLNETITCSSAWRTVPSAGQALPASPALRCRWLAETWEPDFVLLARSADARFRVVGGAVCFPSWWALEEKIGLPLAEVHAIVPGLNPVLGRQIDQFLARLVAGQGWERCNWGLTHTPELNLHPTLNRPRLIPPLRLQEIWLRVEHQSLVALPETGGVLFGIRVTNHPMADLVGDQLLRARLRRALATMPDEVARYKGLAEARLQVIELLA